MDNIVQIRYISWVYNKSLHPPLIIIQNAPYTQWIFLASSHSHTSQTLSDTSQLSTTSPLINICTIGTNAPSAMSVSVSVSVSMIAMRDWIRPGDL